MNMHASLLSHRHGHECLHYALVCMFLFYGLMLHSVMFIRLSLKETCFGNLCFQIECMHVHYFIMNTKWPGRRWWHINCLKSYWEILYFSLLCSVLSSEDADFEQRSDLHWVSGYALALRPSAECICVGSSSSFVALYVLQPLVPNTNHELIFRPPWAVW